MNHSDFVRKYSFDNPLQRLVMLRILMGGSMDGEGERVSQMQAKSQDIQNVLEGLENRRVALIRQQAAEQNAAYQSLLMMNGQHTEFNRLLGLGNSLLAARQGLANSPMRLPQAEVTDKQSDALEKARQDLVLSKLKGEARERARLGFSADALGLTSSPEFQTARQNYIGTSLEAWRNNEASKPEKKTPKSEEQKASEKLEETYKRLISQQQEQIALSGQSTDLAKTKYQVTGGHSNPRCRLRISSDDRRTIARWHGS